MNHFTVVFDSCVLYSATLRNLMVQLATTNIFRARWTDRIHDEWTSNVLRDYPDISPDKLKKSVELMNLHAEDSLVTGCEDLIGSINLPDPDDRHVLAAAIKAGASEIITFNLDDFPGCSLNKYGIHSVHPDDFMLNQMELSLHDVLISIKIVRERLVNRPKSAEEYLSKLHSTGLVKTVDALKAYRHMI